MNLSPEDQKRFEIALKNALLAFKKAEFKSLSFEEIGAFTKMVQDIKDLEVLIKEPPKPRRPELQDDFDEQC